MLQPSQNEFEAYLNLHHKGEFKGCFYLQEKRDFIRGRESGNWKIGSLNQNDIVIKSERISRLHCEIYRKVDTNGVRWIITDGVAGKGSTNGIYWKGTRIVSHTLENGDIINLPDDYSLEFGLREGMKVCNPFNTQS